MTTEPDVTRVVRSWLVEGADRLPDRVLDAVLEHVPTTPQRRPNGLARRLPIMPKLFRVALVAAAVLVVVVAGINLLPRFGVGVAPSPSPSPSPTALGTADLNRLLAADTYRVAGPFNLPFTISMPGGWQMKSDVQGDVGFVRSVPTQAAPWISADLVQGIVIDPCHSEAGVASPYPSTVDEVVAAFGRMVGFSAGPATPVSIGGFSGKELVLTNAIDTSTANCTGGPMLPLFTFLGHNIVEGGTNGGATEHLWILDVHGTLVVIDGETFPTTPEATRLEMLQIVPTIRFE